MEQTLGCLSIIVIALLLMGIAAFPVMWLWNWLMPEIFGLTTIGFWQSLGLLILSSLLFKTPSRTTNN